MSEDKFLARWSRRKQEAKANATPPDPAMRDDMQSPPPAVKDDDAEFDLASLPSIDTITSATDITAFLRKGIPQELTRAALRRAWSADPVIRDFVGLAENAWDFNDPTAMPGFGPLDCSEAELTALIDRIVGGLGKPAQAPPGRSVEVADSSQQLREVELPGIGAEEAATTGTAPDPAATQRTLTESSDGEQVPVERHTHGSALPR
ncbi:DUF3306 domain-containing protein [Bradyrhizobium brasilense]|uniref:DUF3306 domain-containing protein n=1 Tax=Bradyrhizobium brasilense TaxID=1419277 RepID=A0ABY8J717_9BRAD|nr:DUF3306 domain-containing protein [Bradyrhizobium brasilense]WFU61345.1 DUF3306 domain-containing protein [Bradyrhizobium brasilense]